MSKPPTRLPSWTMTTIIGAGVDLDGKQIEGHPVNVSLVLHPDTGALVEVVLVSDGKIGTRISLMIEELGIKISRMIQGRHPDTGEPL